MNQCLVSLGDVARRINQPLYRVAYIVRQRRVDPVLSCGGRKFYAEADVVRIKSELEAIDARKREIAERVS